MVQIIDRTSLGGEIGRSLGQGLLRGSDIGLKRGMDINQSRQNAARLSEALGSLQQQDNQPEMNEEQKFLRFAQAVNGMPNAEALMKSYLQSLKQTSENRPIQQQANPAAQALKDIEALLGGEGVGLSGKFNPSAAARFNRGKFKSLQAAVLPLFKSMFPRGMTEKEFKFIQENYIPQADDTEETIKGKIAGLRQLLGEQMPQSGQPPQQQIQQERQAIPFRDKEGNVYDIPPHLVEQAKKKGLIPQ